jgi:hypothetical protein
VLNRSSIAGASACGGSSCLAVIWVVHDWERGVGAGRSLARRKSKKASAKNVKTLELNHSVTGGLQPRRGSSNTGRASQAYRSLPCAYTPCVSLRSFVPLPGAHTVAAPDYLTEPRREA